VILKVLKNPTESCKISEKSQRILKFVSDAENPEILKNPRES